MPPEQSIGHKKRLQNAQPQNEILRSWGLGGNPQQAAPELGDIFMRYS